MSNLPLNEPVPTAGFWIIESQASQYYSYESITPITCLKDFCAEIVDSNHVEYFVNKAAASDRIAEIGQENIIEL